MEALTNGFAFRPTRRDILRTAAISPVAVSLLSTGCSQSQPPGIVQQGPPMVRALVLENRPRVDLSATEPPMLRVGGGSAERVALPASTPVVYTGSGWKVGNLEFATGELSIEPVGEGSVSVDNHSYRGRYRFVPKAGGKFDVVNDITVEGYLMGVIAKELYSNWHEEAYRAQAIVARTYALYEARTGSPGTHYDLFADTRSQMYGGIAGESAKSRSAIEETHGMVVAFGPSGEERIFKAYYSSCCGGITQPATIFGDPPCEPLIEQNIGPRCAASTKFSWPAVVMSKSEITRRLRIWGANNNAPEKTIGDVSKIDVFSMNRFGRPTSFAITDVRGYRYRLGCEDLRLALNTDATDGVKLFSSFCKPINEAGAIRFADGHGFGHGVGLCQWCAQQQASTGVSYKQIVLGAFPKAVLVRAY